MGYLLTKLKDGADFTYNGVKYKGGELPEFTS
jgi:hypothetical protein